MGNAANCNCGNGPQAPIKEKVQTADGALQNVKSGDFNALDLDSEQLAVAALVLLQVFFSGCGGVNRDVLPAFVCGVRQGYLANPYHNFCHGVDVLQTVFWMGTLMPWDQLFTPLAHFALLVAAFAIDLGHPGYSNVFLIDAGDALACRYNDVSPLENMHCTRLMEILRQDRSNVFRHVPRAEFQVVRKLIIDVILHTDTVHFTSLLGALDSLYGSNSEHFSSGEKEGSLTKAEIELLSTSDNKRLVSRVLVVAANVSNQAKPWKTARAWAELMRQEMLAQAQKEDALGLSVHQLAGGSSTSLPEAQLGMLHLTIAPLMAAEVRIFRGWQPLAKTMASNVTEWGARLAAENGKEEGKENGQKEKEVKGPPADSRVVRMCNILGNPWGSDAQAASKLSMSAWQGRRTSNTSGKTEPASEPSCPEGTSPVPLVREIRRWQEGSNDNAGVDGKQRELILLYVVSDEDHQRTGQPVLFRYTMQSPEDGLSEILPSEDKKSPNGHSAAGVGAWPQEGSGTPLPLDRCLSEPCRAEASADSVCRVVDAQKFESLLGLVLEDLLPAKQPVCAALPTTREDTVKPAFTLPSAVRRSIRTTMSRIASASGGPSGAEASGTDAFAGGQTAETGLKARISPPPQAGAEKESESAGS